MRYKFQVITFKDHYHSASWVDPKTYTPKDFLLQYCGWVTKETDEFVILSQGRTVKESADDVEYDSHIHIMKEAITKRKSIKLENK